MCATRPPESCGPASARTVGFVVLDGQNPFYNDVVRGPRTRHPVTTSPILYGNTDEDHARERLYLDLFEEQQVRGVLIAPYGDVNARLQRLRARGIAAVLVDRFSGDGRFSSVSVDSIAGGRLAVEHLIEQGRRRIAFVGGPFDIRQVNDRLAGRAGRRRERGRHRRCRGGGDRRHDRGGGRQGRRPHHLETPPRVAGCPLRRQRPARTRSSAVPRHRWPDAGARRHRHHRLRRHQLRRRGGGAALIHAAAEPHDRAHRPAHPAGGGDGPGQPPAADRLPAGTRGAGIHRPVRARPDRCQRSASSSSSGSNVDCSPVWPAATPLGLLGIVPSSPRPPGFSVASSSSEAPLPPGVGALDVERLERSVFDGVRPCILCA